MNKKWCTPCSNAFNIKNVFNSEGGKTFKVGDKLYRKDKHGKLVKVQSCLRLDVNVANGTIGDSERKVNMRWVETLMGLPVGWVNPQCENPMYPHEMNENYLKICNEVGNGEDEKRLLGNGVVPSCAAKAFSVLLVELNG